MRIQSIRYDGARVRITWSADDDRSESRTEFAGLEAPLPEFTDALRGLVVPALGLLEIPAAWGDSATVTGMAIRHDAEGMGVIIAIQRPLPWASAPLRLTTPMVRDYGDRPMAGDLSRAVDEMLRVAVRYLSGARAQGDLFMKDRAA